MFTTNRGRDSRRSWRRGHTRSHRCRAAYAAPLKNATDFVYRRAVGDGSAAKRDGARGAEQAERREPPGRRAARCSRRTEVATPVVLGAGATRVRTAAGRLTPLRLNAFAPQGPLCRFFGIFQQKNRLAAPKWTWTLGKRDKHHCLKLGHRHDAQLSSTTARSIGIPRESL